VSSLVHLYYERRPQGVYIKKRPKNAVGY
jgi:hypothetical protein